MYRFMNIRNGAIAALVVTLLLCFLATSSFAVTIFPINGNKKVVDPGPTPYWDMAEPGGDPYGRINTLSSSGTLIDFVDSSQIDNAPISYAFNHDTEFTKILKMLILRIHFSHFYIQTIDNIWR